MSRRRAKKIKQQVEKKRKKEAEKARQKKEAKQAKKEAQKKAKADGVRQPDRLSVSEVLDIVGLVGSVLKALVGRFFKHLRVHVVRLRIVVATGDAATTALAYSAVSESIRVLVPLLEQIPSFRFPDMADIDLGLDYLQESSQVDLCMEFSLRVWHLYSILFHTLRVSLSKGIPLLKQHWARQEGANAGHKPPQAKKKADR